MSALFGVGVCLSRGARLWCQRWGENVSNSALQPAPRKHGHEPCARGPRGSLTTVSPAAEARGAGTGCVRRGGGGCNKGKPSEGRKGPWKAARPSCTDPSPVFSLIWFSLLLRRMFFIPPLQPGLASRRPAVSELMLRDGICPEESRQKALLKTRKLGTRSPSRV